MSASASSLEPASVEDDAAHILVIDDDSRIRTLLSRYLSENGFRITTGSDAADARRKLESLAFDLLIVDVMMPGESGTELTRDIRDKLDVPVIMLTALGETEARIKGFEAGADDYLPKPFAPQELLMRINAVLKRARIESRPSIETVTFGPYTFSIVARELKKNGDTVRLTERERDFLVIFCNNAGEVVPRLELAGDDPNANERTVDVQINRLRRKLESDPANPNWLQTVRGIGYKLHTN